ncbi:anthocyanidin 3-O-glucosyltransferase 7-like [Carya illinoinensis]|uniref:anthocyanidin 3-O-glucosyltransferase 7-like n=1 Tax=Carya illinoinensis TaxID=32201 RepID=UPI001C724E90|nr:anthocyanidin 3-O-glucosyltransferase 7-like [Carya illinoinensis]
MSQSSGKNQHVAVLAFPFGCHPWPLLNLASRLASAAPDVRFSFLNTAKSNQKLFATSGAHLPHNLISYDVADGVPEGHVLTPGNPLEEVELFLEAAPESFRKGMDMAVAESGQRKITCILNDAFLVFGCDMAADMHVKWVPLYVPAPYDLSAHIYSALIHETYAKACGGGEAHGNGGAVGDLNPIDKTLDAIPGLSVMRFWDLPQEILQGNHSNSSSIFARTLRRMREVLPRANAVVMNSFQELNSTILTDDLKSKFQDILYVGFLTLIVPTPPLPPSHSDATGCLPWLDEQKPTSVAYISFGTVAAVPPHEFAALAEALEASCVPFLWSLRENFKAFLPNGFLERTRKQGKIVPWAPQAHVLSHKAVGVYVTHCGYNSVFESIVGAVPMICRPILGDNKMNGRMVEDVWEIGVRVEGGVFTKKGMVKSLELVLGHDQHGRRMREKIRDLKELVVKAAGPDGIASKDFKTLLELISQ